MGPANEGVVNAFRDAERVAKKQRVCEAKSLEALDTLVAAVQAAVDGLAAGDAADGAGVVGALHARLNELGLVSEVSNQTKDLHTAVTKLSKSVDKAFVADITRATRPLDFDRATLDKVIAEHLFQEGKFGVGETFVREAGIPSGSALKEPFNEMHEVLEELRARHLQPALDWVAANRDQLIKANGEASVVAFEFRLHCLRFLQILEKSGPKGALQYARANFAAFQASALPEIQRLMGCLCYVRRPHSSPYADVLLMSSQHWQQAAVGYAWQCCGLLGMACESPLLVAVAAGSVALPTLLKLAAVMAGQSQDFENCTQIPVELELGSEFVFQSVFACPVSREQSSSNNPPMLLPCGHALCKQSILKIAKGPSRGFKCPYCPVEATPSACRPILFPDVQ